MTPGLIRLIALAVIAFVAFRILRDLYQKFRNMYSPKSSPTGESTRAAYEVLGVNPDASLPEIKEAYQTLIQKYHPDRVDDMGPELKEIADAKTKEINQAYQELKKAHRK